MLLTEVSKYINRIIVFGLKLDHGHNLTHVIDTTLVTLD